MPKSPWIPALLVAGAVAVAASAAAAPRTAAGPAKTSPHGDDEGACSSHAELLLSACRADRRDAFLVHIADCVYVTPAEEEKACRAEARAEAAEKAEECEEIYDARLDICDEVGEDRFLEELDPADFVDPDDIGNGVDPNPYWPLNAGHTHVVVGGGEVTVATATHEVRTVGGLPCRVIRDLVFEEVDDGQGNIEYEGVEVTQDWYAQRADGDVIYCGENTYEIVDDLIDNNDGSFANGTDRARAGFLVRALPVAGEVDRQEMASDEAEDIVEYLSLAASPSDEEGGDGQAFPCAGRCLKTFELNPRSPGQAEHKYYLPGTGFVLATLLDEDGVPTGEREEVTCVGSSIDALDDPACGITDPAALFDALCLWAPEALCFD